MFNWVKCNKKRAGVIATAVCALLALVFVVLWQMELARASRVGVPESAIFRGQKGAITEEQKDEMLEKQLQWVLQDHIVLIEGISEASVTVTASRGKGGFDAPAFVSVGLTSGKELTEQQQSSVVALVTGSTGLPEEDVILTVK